MGTGGQMGQSRASTCGGAARVERSAVRFPRFGAPAGPAGPEIAWTRLLHRCHGVPAAIERADPLPRARMCSATSARNSASRSGGPRKRCARQRQISSLVSAASGCLAVVHEAP
jgi:hypothetical protein